MANKFDALPAMRLMRDWGVAHPGVFAAADACLQHTVSWDAARCPLPVDVCRQLLGPGTDAAAAAALQALYAWRQHYQIYSYTAELCDALTAQRDDMELPVSALWHLPYTGLYIQLPPRLNPALYGFWVCYEQASEDEWYLSLTIHYRDNRAMSLPVILRDGWTISRACRWILIRYNAAQDAGANLPYSARAMELGAQDAYRALLWMLPLVVYLCADNADVTVVRRARSIPAAHVSGGEAQAEPTLYAVGDGYTAAIRRYVKANGIKRVVYTDDDDEPVEGAKTSGAGKRPHLRRAHYHHYWQGPRNDPANRRLVLRWIPSILVNADDKPDTPMVTINVVEGGDK